VVDTGGLRSGFGRATKETDRFGRSTNQTSRSTGRLGVNLGRAAVAAAGAAAAFVPLSLAISQAARSTIEFDRSMRNVNSIAQLSEGQFQGLSKSVLELAGPTAQAPRTLADGLYDLVSSGFESKEALDVLEVSAKAATAGLTETEVASKTVAAALNAYRLPAKRASVISDILFRTVDRGVISFEQLSSDIGDVLPFASSLGVGLEEVGASVATMTKAGIGSAETMTRVKNVMVSLLKPGDDLSAAMRSLGYDSGEAMIQAEGFQGTLDALISATDGSKNAVAQLFPNIRALGGVLALTGENSRGAAKDLAGMRDAAGATDRALSQQSQSIYFQWQRLKATAEAMAIEFGTTLVPSIREVLEVLNDDSLTSAEKFSEMRKRIVDAVRQIAPQVAQAAGEVGVILATSMAKAFADTGILGKLAVSAFFLKMLGGPRAVVAAGATVGTMFAKAQAVAMTNVYAYQNARAAGFGAMASSRALGASLVGGLASSFARFLPPALGALAIGDIVLTAIAGDIRGAAVKGGGAAVGGAIGAVLGSVIPGAGTLAGGAIGAGLGTLGAGLIDGIIGGAEREAPKLRERIEASVERIAQAANRERAAYQRLDATARFASESRRRQITATDRVREAERQLARARTAFGPSSEQAIRAERRLARAKDANAKATERVRNAERVYGVERRATRVIITQSVKQQKAELFTLKQKRDRLSDLLQSEKFRNLTAEQQNSISRAYLQVNRAVDKGQRQLNRTYIEAGQKIGPAFAKSMERISGRTESLRSDIQKLRSGVILNADQMSARYRSALERMIKRTELATRVLNVDGEIGVVNSPIVGNRGGGKIGGSGPSVMAAVSPGELISYRGREIYVPGKPEPRDSVLMNLPVGAKVFTYDGQARLAAGASHTQALRDQAPHFATGGIVRPRMVGGLPGQREVANTGFGKVHKAAVAYYRRNSLTDLASAVRLASRFGLTVSSGFRPGDDGYHGIDRARDFVGSPSEMFSFAKFIGTKFGQRLLELIYSPLGWSIKNGARTAPYAVADHYDHVHVAMRKGGIIPAFRRGGNINRIWREHNSGYGDWGGPTLPSYVVAALAQAAGMPGKTMEQVTRGESGAHKKNTARPGATGIDPGGTKGHGLWMITSGYNEDLAARVGGWRNMLNPVVNAWAAAQIYRRQGLGAWYGTGSVTGDGQNYAGNFDIRRALGGLSFDGALWVATDGRVGKKPKAITAIQRGAKKSLGRTDRIRKRFRRDRSGSKGAFEKLAKADRLARKARELANQGKVSQARALMKRAHRLTREATGASGPANTGGGSAGDGIATAPPTTTVPQNVSDILSMANRPGLSLESQETILSNALSIAQGTEGTEDDLSVLGAQLNVQQKIKRQAQNALNRATGKLNQPKFSAGRIAAARKKRDKALADKREAEKKLRNKNLKGEARKKWEQKLRNANKRLREANQILRPYGEAIEAQNTAATDVAAAQGEIASINQEIADIQSGGDGGDDSDTSAADLAAAMEELANAIKEQNRLQSSVQATSSREALRMLSDVISGQIVGKRLPVGQTPTGVRY
jgi:TP901 family phage tail tape measure protein